MPNSMDGKMYLFHAPQTKGIQADMIDELILLACEGSSTQKYNILGSCVGWFNSDLMKYRHYKKARNLECHWLYYDWFIQENGFDKKIFISGFFGGHLPNFNFIALNDKKHEKIFSWFKRHTDLVPDIIKKIQKRKYANTTLGDDDAYIFRIPGDDAATIGN